MPDGFEEYPKIQSLWKRDSANKNRCIVGEWANADLAALRNVDWLWTEKVDGTNVRLGWQPDVNFAGNEFGWVWGRSDNASIPPKLLAALVEIQRAAPYEEVFAHVTAGTTVTLYGEGYGAGIQKGGQYRPDPGFVLFDVKVGPWWLSYENVCDVGQRLGIDVVPLRMTGSLLDAWEAVDPQAPLHSERWPDSTVEGLVGRPPVTLYDAKGERILAKVKVRDHVA